MMLAIGCAAKDADDDDWDGDPSNAWDDETGGTAEFIVTDLTDPSDTILDQWTVDNVLWVWAQPDETNFFGMTLHEETQEFTHSGSAYTMSELHAATRPLSCDYKRDFLATAGRLLDGVEEGDSVSDHCDSLTRFFETMDELVPLHEDIHTEFLAGGLLPWGPPEAEVFEPWDGQATLLQADRVRPYGAGWDATSCHYTHSENWDTRRDWWGRSYSNVRIDSVDGLVIGSMEADLESADGGSLHLQVNFEAQPCQYSVEENGLYHLELRPDTSTDDDGCGDDWVIDGDVAIQPETCLVWGPVSALEMDWFSATTPEEGLLGGCENACPEEGDGWCPTQSGVGGRTDWRLPTVDELMDASMSNPTMDDADGRLWSLTTASIDDDQAWTVDLSRGGAKLSMTKDQQTQVRCVSDSP